MIYNRPVTLKTGGDARQPTIKKKEVTLGSDSTLKKTGQRGRS